MKNPGYLVKINWNDCFIIKIDLQLSSTILNIGYTILLTSLILLTIMTSEPQRTTSEAFP